MPDPELTTIELAGILRDNMDRILVFAPPSLDEIREVCVNGGCVQLNMLPATIQTRGQGAFTLHGRWHSREEMMQHLAYWALTNHLEDVAEHFDIAEETLKEVWPVPADDKDATV